MLSSTIFDKDSLISGDEKFYLSLLEATCYRDAPNDCYSEGDLDLKRWPHVEGEDLVEAFKTSIDLSDFLEHKCFIRSDPTPASTLEEREGEFPDPPGADVFNNNVVRIATIKSWETEFVGSHVTVLHDTLCNYVTEASLYARVVSHVQSSGTGKSRAHDELAKRLLYIPLNLAGPLATSMPPLSAYSSCLAHVSCFSVSAA